MVQMRFATRFVSLAFIGSVAFAPLAQAAFSDVPGGEFAQYVNDLSSKGVISSGTYFYPKQNLTRGELAKVLVKAANLSVNNAGGQRFSDVPTSNTFFDYVATLSNRGTINGYGDGSFRPNGNVSRGEFAKMVTGSFGFAINTSDGPHFSHDVPSGSTFYPYVETLFNRNVVNGYNGTIQFGVNDPVSREQMAKIVSLAMQSAAGTLPVRMAGGAVVSRDIPLTYNAGLPRLTITPGSSSTRASLQPQHFPYLAGGYMYELWLQDATGYHSAGTFNVRNNNVADSRGVAISPNFNLPMALSSVTGMMVTIEPPHDGNTAPSSTIVVRGTDVHPTTAFDLDFPTGIASSDAHAFITMGTSGQNNVLNVDFAQLPDLRPFGWTYGVWFTANGQTQTAGTFVANGSRSAYKSGELPVDLMQVSQVSVSIEPNPDDSDAVSGIIPWTGFASGVSVATTTSTAITSTAQDTDLYKGLTTSMTSPSIRARTVIKSDSSVIVEAYVTSPVLASGEEQTVVVKVSDLNGKPVSDLDMTMSRLDGPTARFTDPHEIGNNTGIYLGSYRVDGSVTTSDQAQIRIQTDSTSSSSRTTGIHSIPSIDLTFDVSSSTRIGTARVMEVDVTQPKLVLNENVSSSSDSDLIVLVIVQDSNHRAVRTVLNSDVQLYSDNSSSTPTGSVSNNVKYYTLDDRFFSLDREDSDITVNRSFSVQLVPGSSDSFDPIVSDQYRVSGQLIARTR